MTLLQRFQSLPLLLLLPLVWRLGFVLATKATGDRALGRLLAPGLALATWLLAIHSLGLLLHAFLPALYLATGTLAALGWWVGRLPLPAAPTPSRPNPWMWLGAALAASLLLGPELRWAEHDECVVSSHIAIPLQIQNGVYPPRQMTFPQFEFRYHYAIDLAGAVASQLFGHLDMLVTVHALALLLWAYTFCLFWMIGERFIGGPASGPVTAFGVLLAGGFPYLSKHDTFSRYLIGDFTPGGAWITPPLISNFLQHPWSLGIPFGACILLIFSSPPNDAPLATGAFDQPRRRIDNGWWWLSLFLLFAALSFSQFVLFVCLLGTVAAVGSLQGRRLSPKALLLFFLWAASLALTARLLHGFLAPTPEPKAFGLEFHPFWRDKDLAGLASWHLQALGFLLPLGILGLWFVQRERLLLLVLVLGSLFVRNFFRYAHSWDIVKFSMVSQLALAILSCAALVHALRVRRTRWLAVLGLALCSVFALGWTAALTLKLPGLFFCEALTPRPEPPDQAAIDYLRHHVREGEAVFRTEHADAYAIHGGLPQPTWDWQVESFGYSDSLYRERRRLLARASPSSDDYLRQSFVWVVTGPHDPELAKYAEEWVRQGRAELRAEFAPLRVYRLSGSPGG